MNARCELMQNHNIRHFYFTETFNSQIYQIMLQLRVFPKADSEL
jgi:hypothetical protein